MPPPRRRERASSFEKNMDIEIVTIRSAFIKLIDSVNEDGDDRISRNNDMQNAFENHET